MTDSGIRRGTIWTVLFFAGSFARTLVLTPMMLQHWGRQVFCFWALILSARALICFLPDSFIRYVANRYNLQYHQDRVQAASLLQTGLGFLLRLSLMLLLLCGLLFIAFEAPAAYLFATDAGTAKLLPGLCLTVYIAAVLLQNVQRLYGALQEPAGRIWQNMMQECGLLLAELLLLAALLVGGGSFLVCMLADSILLLSGSGAYLFYLYRRYRLPVFVPQAKGSGWHLFREASRLYAGNFFEKLSSDGLLLLLSFFRYDQAVIALMATVRTIANTPLLAANLLLTTYTPALQEAYSRRQEPVLNRLFRNIRRYLGALLLAGILLCYPLYEPVFQLWTRGRLAWDPMFLVLLLGATMAGLAGLGYLYVLKGINAMPELLRVMVLKTVLVLLGLLLLPRSADTAGGILLFAEVLTGWVLLPLLTRRKMQQDGLHAASRIVPADLLLYPAAMSLLAILYYLF